MSRKPPFAERSAPPGLAARAYLGVTGGVQPFMPWHLRRRLRRGKEDPKRWREKLGQGMAPRPEGRLVWMHAVGLGESLALRGLIDRLSEKRDLQFLVTSSTRHSGETLGQSLPPNARHQFLPLDLPRASKRFLDHWRPDLAIWSEQDLWPGLVMRADFRRIPLALINARMNADAYRRRTRILRVYQDILPRFAVISAQDPVTADHLKALGAPEVRLDGSLKRVSPQLPVDAAELAALTGSIGERFVWVLGSSHAPDEALAIAAHQRLLARDPGALLIIAPRKTERRGEIAAALTHAGLTHTQRSTGDMPAAQVYLADTVGEMGLWYRVAQAAYVGGSNNKIEGHNPWEPAALGTAVLHGPRVENFADDYTSLTLEGSARRLETPEALADALQAEGLTQLGTNARASWSSRMHDMDDLCQRLLDLIPE